VFGNADENDDARAFVRFGTNPARVSMKEDRRVARTRHLLEQALLALIQERGFEAVTVQDIIDRANVGRSTFYAHFVDREDLLIKAMDPFSAHLKERQRKALRERAGSDRDAFAFTRELFSHAESHRGVFRAIVGKQSAVILQRHFQRMQADLVREEVKAMLAPATADTVPTEAIVQSVASALFGFLVWWMEGRPRLTADQASALFRSMAVAAVKAAARSTG
jgi:AcrR family transcriptional regulator